MIFTAAIRSLVYFRRIARSLDAIAKSLATMAEIYQTDYEARTAAKKPRMAQFEVADVDEINKKWVRATEAKEAGVDIE